MNEVSYHFGLVAEPIQLSPEIARALAQQDALHGVDSANPDLTEDSSYMDLMNPELGEFVARIKIDKLQQVLNSTHDALEAGTIKYDQDQIDAMHALEEVISRTVQEIGRTETAEALADLAQLGYAEPGMPDTDAARVAKDAFMNMAATKLSHAFIGLAADRVNYVHTMALTIQENAGFVEPVPALQRRSQRIDHCLNVIERDLGVTTTFQRPFVFQPFNNT